MFFIRAGRYERTGFLCRHGWDYTARFYRKGLVRYFKEVMKNPQVHQVLANLSNLEEINNLERKNILVVLTESNVIILLMLA